MPTTNGPLKVLYWFLDNINYSKGIQKIHSTKQNNLFGNVGFRTELKLYIFH